MSAVAAAKTNLLAAIRTQLPGVQVSVAPPAEDTATRESIWVERIDADFEWQCLGPVSQNHRRETIGIDLAIHVYREASDQTDAADAALTRADALFDSVEAASSADETLAGAVSWWLVTRWSLDPRPREAGWSASGRAHIEAIKNP